MDPNKEQTRMSLSRRERIDVLLAEYDSLNQLLRFRLTAMDRRLPVAVSFMAATIAAVLALPLKLQLAVLIATPSAILWIGRTRVRLGRSMTFCVCFDDIMAPASRKTSVHSLLMRFARR